MTDSSTETELDRENNNAAKPALSGVALAQVFGFSISNGGESQSLISKMGATLFEAGEGEGRYVTGPDGKRRWQRTSTRSRQDAEAQKVFNTLTGAADGVGVPREVLFQVAYATKDGTLAGNEGQRQTIVEDVDYLKLRGWGEKILVENPQLIELADGIKKLNGLQGQEYQDALKKDPHLAALTQDHRLGAILIGVTARRRMEAKGGYDPERGQFLSPEDMRDVTGRLIADQYFGETQSKDIYSKDGDTSPYFTEEEIKATPALKEFAGKSAHEIIEWAKDKIADVSPLLQSAPTNQPIAANYNEIDRRVIGDVNIGRLKTAIFGNESAHTISPYDAEGPICRNGDHAYGKYQVMGRNIPDWTRRLLGREMTPAEFLKDHDAQEFLASARLSEYVEKSLRLHDGQTTPQKIVYDTASYWQSGRDYDTAVALNLDDRHWTVAKYGIEAWKKYQSIPPSEAETPVVASVAPTSAMPGAIVASRNDLAKLNNLQIGPRSAATVGGGILGLPLEIAYRIPLHGDFGAPRTGHEHAGIDMARPDVDGPSIEGANIHPAADGVVTRVFLDKYGHGGGYGNAIEIQHNINGRIIYTRYAHMQQPSRFQVGDIATTRDVIGTVGQTGEGPDMTGAHLHFEVRDENRRPLDPKPWLAPSTAMVASAAPIRSAPVRPTNTDSSPAYKPEDRVTVHLVGDSNAQGAGEGYLKAAFRGKGFRNVEVVNGGIPSTGFRTGYSAAVRGGEGYLTLEERIDRAITDARLAIADPRKAGGNQQIALFAGHNDSPGANSADYLQNLDRVFAKLAAAQRDGIRVTIFSPVHRDVEAKALPGLPKVAEDFQRVAAKNGLTYVDLNTGPNGQEIHYTHREDTHRVHLTVDDQGYGAVAKAMADGILHPPAAPAPSLVVSQRTPTGNTSNLAPTRVAHRGDVKQIIPPPGGAEQTAPVLASSDAADKKDASQQLSGDLARKTLLAAAEKPELRTGANDRHPHDSRSRVARRHDKMHETMLAAKKKAAGETQVASGAHPVPSASTVLKA